MSFLHKHVDVIVVLEHLPDLGEVLDASEFGLIVDLGQGAILGQVFGLEHFFESHVLAGFKVDHARERVILVLEVRMVRLLAIYLPH